VTIRENASLESFTTERLTQIIGYVYIWYNPLLKNAFGPSLRLVSGDLNINGNDSLSDPGLVNLTHTGGLEITHNASIRELVLPALNDTTLFGMFVGTNASLGHIDFPLLRQGDFEFRDNPVLPACEVRALFARTLGEHHESGNDETAGCAP
jgi:hypothetical protein